MDISKRIQDAYNAMRRPALVAAGLAIVPLLGACPQQVTQDDLAREFQSAYAQGAQMRTVEFPHGMHDAETVFINTDSDPAYDIARVSTPHGMDYRQVEITDAHIDAYGR